MTVLEFGYFSWLQRLLLHSSAGKLLGAGIGLSQGVQQCWNVGATVGCSACYSIALQANAATARAWLRSNGVMAAECIGASYSAALVVTFLRKESCCLCPSARRATTGA
jgi:hypothetical protein